MAIVANGPVLPVVRSTLFRTRARRDPLQVGVSQKSWPSNWLTTGCYKGSLSYQVTWALRPFCCSHGPVGRKSITSPEYHLTRISAHQKRWPRLANQKVLKKVELNPNICIPKSEQNHTGFYAVG